MGLALLGALAGFAQGLGSRVEKEREENEELLKTRLQLAAVNKKKREEEVKAVREELSGRYSEVMPWLEPTTDEAVKLALISNPEIAKQFAQRRRDGETIDAATFVREKADEIRKKAPKGFETVRKYIDSFGVAPTPMTEEQMQQAFGQKEGFMGFNVGTKPGRAEKIASGLGVGSARELLAYENMQPLQKEPLADLATINTELFPVVDKDPKDTLNRMASTYAQAVRIHGEGTKPAEDAKNNYIAFESALQSLSSDGADWKKEENKLRSTIANPNTPAQEKEAARTRLAAGNANIPNSTNEIIKTFKDAAANALNKAYPGSKGLSITMQDGMLSYQYLTTSDAQLKAYKDVEKRAIMAAARANGYINARGEPLSESVSGALAAVLNPSIEVGSGAVVDASPSKQPAPSNVPAAAAAAQSSVPARPAFQAQPPAATTQPVTQGGLGARPASAAPERATAPSTIQQRDGKFIVTVNNPDGSSQRFEFANKQQADSFQKEADKLRGTR
jgi:hypothetical protein